MIRMELSKEGTQEKMVKEKLVKESKENQAGLQLFR